MATNRNLKAQACACERLGNEQIVTCRLEEGGHLIQVRTGPEVTIEENEEIHLDPDPDGWRLFDSSGESIKQ